MMTHVETADMARSIRLMGYDTDIRDGRILIFKENENLLAGVVWIAEAVHAAGYDNVEWVSQA